MESLSSNKVQLLLHTEDGFIPFLTPYLLLNYFPPNSQDIKDYLVLGVAVKDTCIGPIYRDVTNDSSDGIEDNESNGESKNKKKRKRKNNDYSVVNADISGTKNVNNDINSSENKTEFPSTKKKDMNVLKPIGYKFNSVAHKQLLSAQLSGYNSILLPTFDLIDDLNNFTSEKISNVNENNYGKKKQECNGKVKVANGIRPSIASSNNHVSLCTPHGIQKLNFSTYSEITAQLQVDSFVSMYDQVYPEDKKKRREKCIDRTKKWIEAMTQLGQNEDKLKTKRIWYPLDCNAIFPDDEAFKKDIHNIIPQNDCIAGVYMVGWHHRQNIEHRIKLLQKCSNSTQSSSLSFIVPATNNLRQIIEAVKHGASMFGSALAAKWARERKALALTITCDQNQDRTLKIGDSKKFDGDGCIDLSDPAYAWDDSPLVPDCQCFSGKYTKSYVHHLIQAKELLADIILFGHNLHQMISLCKEFSLARTDGKIDEFCTFLQNQIV